VVVDISLTTEWMKSKDIRFFVEPNFIWCDECTGGVAVFGVNNVVNSFSKQR